MTVYTYKGKSAYIDDRLAKELEDDVIPDLVEKDSDSVFCIDGPEGSGKSKLADNIGGFVASKLLERYNIDINYSADNFHLSPLKFRDAILKADKNEIVVYDEAHKGMGSRRSLSEINNILNDLMMEMRQKNLFVILVLPTFFMLDKYPAIFRTRGLFHVYKAKNSSTGKKERGYWVYFNQKYKLQLYIKGKQYFNYNCVEWPPFTGRFLNQYIIDEATYRIKKREAFKQHGARETKAEVWKSQRDSMIYALHIELKVGADNLRRLLAKYDVKLSDSILKKIFVSKEIELTKGATRPVDRTKEIDEDDDEEYENDEEDLDIDEDLAEKPLKMPPVR